MEILHVPSACALLQTLSIISPLDLTMDSPTRGTFLQEVLVRSDGHFCSICHKNCKLRDTDLGTMDTTESCRRIFCFNCLSTYKRGRIEKILILQCPNCSAVSVDIIRHESRPSNDVEVTTNEPTDCSDWAMDTTSSTGIGNRHEERCVRPLVCKKVEKLPPGGMQQEGAQTLSRGLARSSLLHVDTWRSAFLSRAQWALYKMG